MYIYVCMYVYIYIKNTSWIPWLMLGTGENPQVSIFIYITYTYVCMYIYLWASQVVLVVKNPPANPGDMDLIPGSGRSPGGGYSNLL